MGFKVIFDIPPKNFGEYDDVGRLWIEGTASTPTPDEENWIIHPDAFLGHIKSFLNNPVMLFMHNHRDIIGRFTKLEFLDSGIKFRGYISQATTDFMKNIHELVRSGSLSGVSISFIPLEKEEMSFEEAIKMGLITDEKVLNPLIPIVTYVKEAELIEISLVAVGMNREALLEKGLDVNFDFLLSGKDTAKSSCVYINKSIENLLIGNDGDKIEFSRNKKIEDGENNMEKGMEDKEELVEKSVVPYKKFPKADLNTPWSFDAADGNAILDRGGWRLYKAVHTWVDTSEGSTPERKQAYKLPHHKIIDDGVKTVWNGVRAAMAALLGARGGVDIPESDRKGVYNHLSRHYLEFDKEPPEFKSYNENNLEELLVKNPELVDHISCFIDLGKFSGHDKIILQQNLLWIEYYCDKLSDMEVKGQIAWFCKFIKDTLNTQNLNSGNNDSNTLETSNGIVTSIDDLVKIIKDAANAMVKCGFSEDEAYIASLQLAIKFLQNKKE